MNCNQQTSLKFLETQKQFLSVMFSCGWGIGTSTGSANDGSNDGRPSGSTTVNVVDKGSVKESNTHATIGKGNIEIADGSDTSDINRDISKTETITKDEITGALDATVKIDNRIFTEAGREDIAKDFSESADLAVKITKEVGNVLKVGTEKAINTVVDIMSHMTPEQQKEMVVGIQAQNLANMAKNIAENNPSKNPQEFPEIKTMEDAAKEIIKYQGKKFEDLIQEDIDKVTYIYNNFNLTEGFMDYRDKRMFEIIDGSLDGSVLEAISKAQKSSDKVDIKDAITKLVTNYNKNMGLDKDIEIKYYSKDDDIFGSADSRNNVLYINENNLNNVSSGDKKPIKEAVDTVTHETLGHMDTLNIGNKLNNLGFTNWIRDWVNNREEPDNYVTKAIKNVVGSPVPSGISDDIKNNYKYIDSATKGMYVRDGELYYKNPTEVDAWHTGESGADHIMSKVDQYDKNKQ